MKTLLTTGIFIVILIVVTIAAHAAKDKKNFTYKASLMSSKGYWILQESKENSKQVIVMYYTNQHELVEKETRSKRNADIRRKKVLRSLKRTLEEALDWAEPISWNTVSGSGYKLAVR